MRIVLVMMVFAAVGFSCKKSKTNNDCDRLAPDCSLFECIAHWDNFNFKLIDKTTGQDLVFGPNPRYTVSDVKIYFDAARVHPMQYLRADSANKKFNVMTGRKEMYLEVKGTDVYKLTAEFRFESCCTSIVKNLWQDGSPICTCCADVIQLPVN